jgi:hypothetical protein
MGGIAPHGRLQHAHRIARAMLAQVDLTQCQESRDGSGVVTGVALQSGHGTAAKEPDLQRLPPYRRRGHQESERQQDQHPQAGAGRAVGREWRGRLRDLGGETALHVLRYGVRPGSGSRVVAYEKIPPEKEQARHVRAGPSLVLSHGIS